MARSFADCFPNKYLFKMNAPKSLGGTLPSSVGPISQRMAYQNISLKMGPTKTLPAGSQAKVINTGPPHAPTLEFHIPAGAPGSIAQVAVTPLPSGTLPTVANTGTPEAASITLGIPKGDKGDKGDMGPIGRQGTGGAPGTLNIGSIYALPAGSTPTVTNTGTKTNAILNFGFPVCGCSSGHVFEMENMKK